MKKNKRPTPPCVGCGTTDYRLDGLQISSYSTDLATGLRTCWRCLKLVDRDEDEQCLCPQCCECGACTCAECDEPCEENCQENEYNDNSTLAVQS